MKYTLEALDQAIINVLGEQRGRAQLGEGGHDRVQAHKDAIIKAFMDKLDNHDTNVLRAAWEDVSKGWYKPIS